VLASRERLAWLDFVTLGITYTPTHPEAGDIVTITATGTTGDPAFARFELASVPSLSALTPGMLVDVNGEYINTLTPDVAGRYEITPYDVRAFVGQPQHSGDPSVAREVVVGIGGRSAVNVVSLADLRIATLPGHDITLRLGIFASTVYSAELVNPATDLARLAALSTTVVAALTALEGVAVNVISTATLLSRVTALRTAYEAHRILVGGSFIHASADTTNVTNYEPPNSDDAALACLQELYERIRGHELAGASGGVWHTNDDTKNTVITPAPLTKAQAIVTLSDLEERVYERHRVQTSTPSVHGAADTGNTLAAPHELTNVIVAYLDFIASNAAIAIDNENEGLGTVERVLGVTTAP